MNHDVQVIEMLSLLCENQLAENDEHDSGWNSYLRFETSLGFYAVTVNVATDKTHIICRDNAPEKETHPNGIVFMDGFWFGVESEEYQEMLTVISEYSLESNTKALTRKLDNLKSKGLLPDTIQIL